GVLSNALAGAPNCLTAEVPPECATETGVAAWVAVKDASPNTRVYPGQTVTYTVEVRNVGSVDLFGISFDDDLSDVLDGASFRQGEGRATRGAVAFDAAARELSWSGNVPVGESATITYAVTVTVPGPLQLRNVLIGTPNCPDPPLTSS